MFNPFKKGSLMQLVDLDQNTKKWLEERKNHIGGSDVGSILSVSPWRTVF